jgi:rare lipoprotein A
MKSRLRLLSLASLLAAALLAAGCAETQLASHYIKRFYNGAQPETSGTYKVGKPYQVGSVWYYPEENFRYVETGIASWYGPDFHGGRTANGELYDENEMTAAHRTLQLPCFVRVTNLENGRSVVVRINDRGPYLHGRVIDMSKRAAQLLGFINKGTARVRLEVLEKESRRLADAARRGEDTTRMSFSEMRQQPAPVQQIAAVEPESGMRPAVMQGSQAAEPSIDADAVPESLKTPTITVEELNRPGAMPAAAAASRWSAGTRAAPNPPRAANANFQPVALSTHMSKGRNVPDPVVSQAPVRPTGIFVQAGSFGVRANADKLADRLASIAHTSVESVTVGGRSFYRVRLGPMASVAQADAVLEKAIHAGSGAGRVVKNN